MRLWKSLTLLCSGILFLFSFGCGKTPSEVAGHKDEEAQGERHGHEEGAGAEEAVGAEFKEGKGIVLQKTAMEAIGIKTVEVTEQKIRGETETTAQVFKVADNGEVMASGLLKAEEAKGLKPGQRVEIEPTAVGGKKLDARLVSLDQQIEGVLHGQVEAILSIPDKERKYSVGSLFRVSLVSQAELVTALPRSALLETAAGSFVYVKNEEFFFRTEIKTGSSSDELVEVVEGLYAGDIVVIKGAEALWLIELRFTKGGGHSH